jgi:hypothetical protein
MTRRRVLQVGALAGAGLLLQRQALAADAHSKALPLITKPIPSSGEKLPVIGVGTNAYGVSAPDELASRLEVLRHLPQLGGSVVDTAPAYGTSEAVIGDLVAQIGNRNKLFLATWLTARRCWKSLSSDSRRSTSSWFRCTTCKAWPRCFQSCWK